MEFEAMYELNNIIYTISGSQELHDKLNDTGFFLEYIKSNEGAIEMRVLDSEANIPDYTPSCGPSQEHHRSEETEPWIWTKKSILLFLECLRKHKGDLRNPKKKKKEIWKTIQNEMIKHGFLQIDEAGVERKFRNLKATYKTIKDNKKGSATGRGQVKWEYFQQMDEIFEEDKTINIGHTISSFSSEVAQGRPVASTSVASNANAQTVAGSAAQHEIPASSGINVGASTAGISNEALLSSVETLTTPTEKSPLSNFEDKKSNSWRTPKSSTKKSERGKQLYGLRKKQLEIEDSRLQELKLLREAIEENNRIQKDRNNLLKLYLEKNKP